MRCEAQQADDRARRPRETSSTVCTPQLRGRLCLSIPIQTALQLHAATAHTDVERPLLSARCWHGLAMTGANGKLIAAAYIERSDLVLDKLADVLR